MLNIGFLGVKFKVKFDYRRNFCLRQNGWRLCLCNRSFTKP